MIGVVIWSNEANRKAVIWCEDQGPLAYLRDCDSLTEQADWPVPGDLLRLECETIGNLRHAHSVCLIAPRVCPQLPEVLLGEASRPGSHLHVVASRNSAPQPVVYHEDEGERAHLLPSAINS